MSRKSPAPKKYAIPDSARIAIIAARFNSGIVEELLKGCVARLRGLGVGAARVEIFHVPGAFELPLAAKWASREDRFSAVICLGAVIRGDTPHFDYVAGGAASGIQRVSIEESIPVIFGVLTTNTELQARQRISPRNQAGKRAAEAAIEMIALAEEIAAAGDKTPF